ncbi:DUF6171 family protein [Oceanobacillus manasiensis]|uniref:DUF6171 family protein n=1 Tax=Oceanobacillus manasiensis TaxID=586413 RepID=UPI0005A82ECB|nr:DUF6171 family protein [Oceanobacillus manasiensis]
MTCKSCNRSIAVPANDLHELLEEQLALETNLVDDVIFEERLAECANCPFLINETTCGHCGCFVQFRARLAYKQCPDPEETRWQ